MKKILLGAFAISTLIAFASSTENVSLRTTPGYSIDQVVMDTVPKKKKDKRQDPSDTTHRMPHDTMRRMPMDSIK